ncbi:MAG: tyrosine-protein phosphatase, partial [Prevotella sp.]|nr:tyrosine-protein phosphatase [Prevotella sp.]
MKSIYLSITVFILSAASCQKTDKQAGQAFYEGEELSDKAQIIRDKHTKATTFVINTSGKWVLYAGFSTDKIDYSKPVAGSFVAGRYQLAVSDSSRLYFQLVSDKGRCILSEKRLPMEGGYNFRDLGGIRSKDGKHLKWGKLFRTDDMCYLSDNDLTYLESIPVTTVVDFRENDEIKQAPDNYPASVKNVRRLPVMPGSLSMKTLSTYTSSQLDTVMMKMNVTLVSDSAAVRQYRLFFRLLQEEKNIPLLFHCSAGKDRTGMAAALILFALNVDEA